MQELQPIEGITPGMLWTALIVLIGIATLFVLYGKVVDTYRKLQEIKRLKNDPGNKLAEEISQKVIDRLEPRFADIDRKLATDKLRLDDHTQKLSDLGKKTETEEEGQKAICRGVLALLSHEINGNSADKLKSALENINDYLIEK